MRTKRGECGTRGENTERAEGDTNGVDVTGKVTKFRKAQQGGTAVQIPGSVRQPHSTKKSLVCIVNISRIH